ncbi:hypothetical protein SAMD00019534_010100, partial [Acytostelium subglobosum LB1]|uniref:hypothetical protein n=1 Tax=Acytostelium subglobosum LB1 TaxID=1410327 RepID=UPI0006451834
MVNEDTHQHQHQQQQQQFVSMSSMNSLSMYSGVGEGLDCSGVSSTSIGCSLCKCQHHNNNNNNNNNTIYKQQQQYNHNMLPKIDEHQQQQQQQQQQYVHNEEEQEEGTSSSLVRLNVGGKKYITTRDTLLSKGENFFSSLLTGNLPSIKEDGYYFIDRNGRYFEYILEFLRTGYVDNPIDVSIESIFREADFYLVNPGFQLQWLAQQLHKSASASRSNSSNECRMIQSKADSSMGASSGEVNATQSNAAAATSTMITAATRRRHQQHQQHQHQQLVNNQDIRWSLGGLVERLLKI